MFELKLYILLTCINIQISIYYEFYIRLGKKNKKQIIYSSWYLKKRLVFDFLSSFL